MLSAILWLGNIDFNEEAGDKSSISDPATLDFVSNLLGVPSHMLKNALEVRVVETKHGGNRGTHYNVPLNRTQALAGRDALAKALYDRLFTVSLYYVILYYIYIIFIPYLYICCGIFICMFLYFGSELLSSTTL